MTMPQDALLPEPAQARLDSLQARLDSLQARPDTAATDTVLLDTASALGRLERDVGVAGQLLATGEYQLFLEQVIQSGIEFVLEFLVPTVLLLAVLLVLYRFLSHTLHRVLTRSKHVDPGLQNLLQKTFRVVALAFIVVVVFDQVGFNVTALLAGLSIAGIAIGFAARDTLENFISGVTILLDRPFRVGDQVEIEELYGTVEEITLRSTRLRTLNHTIMVLPNVHMIQNKVINHSMLGVVRVEIAFGIAYKEFPAEARRVVMALTEGDDRLHDGFPPSCVVTQLGASSVDMVLRLYLKNPKQEVPMRFEYVEKIREALREADIEIPFPHLQMFLDEAKGLREFPLLQPRQGDGA